MTQKKLPYNKKVFFITECWTFQRLAIIETIKNHESWLISHYNIFMDDYYEIRLGELEWLFTPYDYEQQANYFPTDYYRGILETEEIENVDSKNIVNVIINTINEDSYILADFNFGGNDDETLNIHEVLIIGYDDNAFYFVVPNESDQLYEMQIEYDLFVNSFAIILDHYKRNQHRQIYRSILYSYPVTKLTPNHNYSPLNQSYAALRRILLEINSSIIDIKPIDEKQNHLKSHKAYRGLACILGLGEGLAKYIPSKDSFNGDNRRLRLSVKKISEYQKLIHLSMEYIYNNFHLAVDKDLLKKCIDEFKVECTKTEKWSNLVIKYLINDDIEIIKRVIYEIDGVYEKEMKILRLFFATCCNQNIDWENEFKKANGILNTK